MLTQEIKPFLKWSGNKQLVANAIHSQFPVRFSRYFEPLVGGGSVFLSLKRPSCRWEGIGDVNGWLTDTYRALRDSCDRVVEILGSLVTCKTVYNRVREVHPDRLTPEYKAAHLIYLNQLCFGNIFRVNRQGYFNVPFQGPGFSGVFDPQHLYQVQQRLRDVEIYTGDFSTFASQAQAGDFVYFDPPGDGGSSFGFHGYSQDPLNFYGFKNHDYRRLFLLCYDLDLREFIGRSVIRTRC